MTMRVESDSSSWRIWVDTGGTFTDCLAVTPEGTLKRAKVLSRSALRGTIRRQEAPNAVIVAVVWEAPPDFFCGLRLELLSQKQTTPPVTSYDPVSGRVTFSDPLSESPAEGATFEIRFPGEPPVLAVHLVTGTVFGAPLPPLSLRVATTRGTNALLTRQGTLPAFFVTAGFGDLLEIGTQQRPDLYALDIVKPSPLYESVVEVNERLDASGQAIRPLAEEQVREQAKLLVAKGIRTAAIALLHADVNPQHERLVAAQLRAAGFSHISLSSELAPQIGILSRARTAVANAYLSPVVDAYIGGILSALGAEANLHLMTSAGGLVPPSAFRAKDSLLSGPAGGIVGASQAGRAAGFDRIITFDMGGTSTDVARFDAASGFEYVWEHGVGDAHLVAPALAIESVAAGGGSICRADSQGLQVGPQSAGAFPGPACYGAGGPLCVTDVNLLLGYLLPERFEIPLDRHAASQAAEAVHEAMPEKLDRDRLLEGLREIANERMADAIRRISVQKGVDPAEYALVAFGGAGGQHGCAVASRLGMKTVIVPADASLLSAWGLGHARIERFAERQVLRPLDALETSLSQIMRELASEATTALLPRSSEIVRRLATLRLTGQETALTLDLDPDDAETEIGVKFQARYAQTYGYPPPPQVPIELVSLRVVAAQVEPPSPCPSPQSWGEGSLITQPIHTVGRVNSSGPPLPPGLGGGAGGGGLSRARFNRQWLDVPVHERASLSPNQTISGPALIVEQHSAIVVEPGWEATPHPSGALVLTATTAENLRSPATTPADAVQLELFAGRFAAIAEEMGETLRRTALSTNVKERLDFSCGLLAADGALVASAAHIPVHLGALGLCVRSVAETTGPFAPGDVLVTNHPAFGGSHLPDVTVITPVFDDAGCLLGYAASRAHHAEIGGTRPGSMPPDATTLREEGVVLPPLFLVKSGGSCLDDICRRLTEVPYPTRNLRDNRADLEAAVAANRLGAERLTALARVQGTDVVWQYLQQVQERVERLLRLALRALPDGTYPATEFLDDGTPITVTITIEDDQATVDFTGTGATHPGNLNAPPAVTHSAVLYVLRLLVQEPLPLNEGLLRPVTLILPPGTLVAPRFEADPAHCPAVVGGNTETSQRIVDTLIKALGLCACGQGTMNNTLWGTERFGYYETVCGGAGATPNAPGAHAVHTHMTNTRITDAEILERRYPVRVERFAIRRGSGGAGKHPGGDGVIRETVYLTPMALSVLTQHRVEAPYGMAGGKPGATGCQHVVRAADGEIVKLASVNGCEMLPGDRLVLETPGGGGYGL